MPIYEYRCLSCGYQFEEMQRISDEPIKTCPKCGGPVQRLISNTSFILKGSGWYKTDYTSYRKEEHKKSSSQENNKSSVNGDKKSTKVNK